jgi:hypothetical protein
MRGWKKRPPPALLAPLGVPRPQEKEVQRLADHATRVAERAIRQCVMVTKCLILLCFSYHNGLTDKIIKRIVKPCNTAAHGLRLLIGVLTMKNPIALLDVVASFPKAAVAKATAKADTSVVVQLTAKGNHITVSVADETLFNALFASQSDLSEAIHKADIVSAEAVKARYGNTAPSFEAYRATKACFNALAKHIGLASTQYIDKPFNAAIKQLYGKQLLKASGGASDLPVSMSKEAIQKRASRESLGQNTKVQREANIAALKAGAVKGDTATRAASASETIEQFIARVGTANVLTELSRILATKRESATDATVLKTIATHYK